MPNALNAESTREIVARLAQANRQFAAAYPGDPADRQPVHTVYGGAHLFRADLTQKLGAAARRTLDEYAPDAATFARAIGLGEPGARDGVGAQDGLAAAVYARVI